MRQKSERRATPEQIVKNIRRATRKHHSAEEKIRVIISGGAEAWRVGPELAAAKVPVIIDPTADRPGDLRLNEHLGVNYDCCHIALQYESPREALGRLRQHKIKVSKLHLSNALKVKPTAEVRQALHAFADEVYFHQVIARSADGRITRHKDLDVALALHNRLPPALTDEWRGINASLDKIL